MTTYRATLRFGTRTGLLGLRVRYVRKAAIVVACLAGGLSGLDTSVNIAFPAITAGFDLDPVQIQWVVVSYVLTYATLLLPLGRLADRVGHGRVLVAGLTLSITGVAACSAAPIFRVFLAARVVQGIGIGLVLAAAPALVTLAVPADRQPRALGAFQMSVALGVAIGPPLGGLLLDLADWRAVFWFRVPVGMVILGFALRLGLHASTRPRAERSENTPLDLGGALSLGVALTGLLVAARWGANWGWGSSTTLEVVAVGLVALTVFVIVESRAAFPLVDLALFRIPSFALANGLNLIANATQFVLWLLGPYLFVTVRGHGTILGGLLFSAMSATAALASAAAGPLTARVGSARLSALGLAVQAVGLAAVSRVGKDTPTLAVAGTLAVVGLGLGLFAVPNLSFVMGSIPRTQQGVASGMTQMVRTVGIVAGVAAANSLFDVLRRRESLSTGETDLGAASVFVPSFQGVALAAAGVCGLAAVLAVSRCRGQRVGVPHDAPRSDPVPTERPDGATR